MIFFIFGFISGGLLVLMLRATTPTRHPDIVIIRSWRAPIGDRLTITPDRIYRWAQQEDTCSK